MLPALFGSMFFGMITSKSAGEYIIHGKLKAVVLPLIVIVLVNFFVTPISGKEMCIRDSPTAIWRRTPLSMWR